MKIKVSGTSQWETVHTMQEAIETAKELTREFAIEESFDQNGSYETPGINLCEGDRIISTYNPETEKFD